MHVRLQNSIFKTSFSAAFSAKHDEKLPTRCFDKTFEASDTSWQDHIERIER